MILVKYEDLLKEKNYTLIDVRTPKEFKEEPIPGAINIPLLLDEERIDVGTAYKQVSPEKAKELGVEAIAKRLPDIFREVQKHAKGRLAFYCARGGMRSGSMAALFEALGYTTWKLDGGYRAYRQYILDNVKTYNKDVKYIVLHGKTGIGKTKILQKLEKKGYSVLDLEKIANHKGSFFGGVCEKEEQSQKKFDSLIFDYFYKNKPDYVIAESESKRIGNVYVPEDVFQSLRAGIHLSLETPIKHRVEIIRDDYAGASIDELQACLDKVSRYIGKDKYQEYSNMLKENKIDELSEVLMIEYYDPLYQKSIDKYVYDSEIFYETLDEGVEKVVRYLNEKGIFGKEVTE
ncbi:tRNA 2-selenouridine(34) synthase MnmH [Cetobacterium somerae]|uniref:tRNA 2-selenouridine(34) synthase MnmH n=1 Tax=Cetobacterium sp. NK01 TaxID=2993530 RepID=UPI002116F00D|nr:tRNA 2-selenouridine(34) synthase MnmH [Cetobacterium sp. NK01]MCQ8212610.1 tRNA 2-selenouridine(34) synthase MnmH [Cetobacterium sp. NK01]